MSEDVNSVIHIIICISNTLKEDVQKLTNGYISTVDFNWAVNL